MARAVGYSAACFGRADGARRRARVPPLLQKHMPNAQDFIPFRKKLNAKGQPVPL
jgi:hypothetical protein